MKTNFFAGESITRVSRRVAPAGCGGGAELEKACVSDVGKPFDPDMGLDLSAMIVAGSRPDVMAFEPNFQITPGMATALMRIEAATESRRHLPVTPAVLSTLRETARLYSTHYSIMIEGNRPTQEQVSRVLENRGRFPGGERDEKEVLGYYAALEKMEALSAAGEAITERHIQVLHALVMAGGKEKVKPTAYRDGQSVIRDGRSRTIVYLPPEAKDVPELMSEMVAWLNAPAGRAWPCPIRAGVARYQYATIHPYYDGIGRTARLLTNLVLHLGGYDLKGLCSLEEYYARGLSEYYDALTIGPSHNYYEGRARAEFTRWLECFCDGMAESFETVKKRTQEAAMAGARDLSGLLRALDPR